MSKRFSYTLLRDWFRTESDRTRPELNGILPHQKLLLLSDGSLTLDLELLYGSKVEVEVKYKGTGPLPEQAARYLDEKAGGAAMEREVWLTVEGKKLVYAHTLIPLSCIEGGLKEELERNANEPLGRVLTSNKVFFSKEKLEVGVVRCRSAAVELGSPAQTPFIARRYILSNREPSGVWVIKASVTEIFSPELVSSDLTRGVALGA
ncbi:MAG TPA: chorismate lyase [Thermodesulfobacteriota bacterium]|nr:chorismate lyase [Thermodesulfobacteriota bacterium]